MASFRPHGLIRAIVLDFYGTLAEMTPPERTWADVLGDRGYVYDEAARRRYWEEGIDDHEHDEHSQSRDHYVAWQKTRTKVLLEECGVPDAEHAALVDELHAMLTSRFVTSYAESAPVLTELRNRGLTLAVCSNWDWDLDQAIDAAGLTGFTDVVVSSAWVGARKPHPRIYTHTLDQVGLTPEECLFVGDTWACDVEGPRTAGFAHTVYVRRPHFGIDHTAPDDAHTRADVVHTSSLEVLLDFTS